MLHTHYAEQVDVKHSKWIQVRLTSTFSLATHFLIQI